MNQITDQKTLAVIMACHNRRERTLSSLRALRQQSIEDQLRVEVFLLDDGSTDGTSEAVQSEFPDVHLIQGDGSLFWNRGMHRAFSAAIERGFDYYLWLNDDTDLYSNAIEVLLKTSTELKNRGFERAIVGSAMQDPVTGDFAYGGVIRHRSRLGRVKLEKALPADTATQCDACNGNCILIPARVVETVGNLDPLYTHRWGDHDYCFRALQQGCSVWVAPGYLGTCERNSTEGSWEDTSLPMMARFRKLHSPQAFQLPDYAIYMRRHRGPWWPAHLVWPYIKILLQTIKR